MKHQAVYAALLACGLSFAAQQATATAVIAATEPTQILNHIELLAQYQKQLQQSITQVNSYIALEQQLKALPTQTRNQIEGVRQGFSGGGAATLDAAERMLTAMQNTQGALPTLVQASQHAYDTVNLLSSQGHSVSVQQYELGVSALAQQHVAAYEDALNSYKQQSQVARTNMQDMTRIADSAPQIKSEVGGLSALLQSNSVLGQQLTNINASLLQNAVVQTSRAKAQAQAASDEAAKESVDSYRQQVIANRLLGTPPPSAPVTESTGDNH